MKLAQALLLRADLQKKLASLGSRLTEVAKIQEGDSPAEDPASLLAEAEQAVDKLEMLIYQINKANLQSTLPDGRDITSLLAKRDMLLVRHRILTTTRDAAVAAPDRYSGRELRWVPAVDVSVLQKQMDEIGRQIRELNGTIQEANWSIEVKVEI